MAAPTTATVGDTLSWLTSLPSYPATAGWVLTWTLLPLTGSTRTLTCTAEGAAHRATASATVTAGWTAGVYTLIATVSNGTERYTLSQSRLTLQPNLASASTGIDLRSSAAKALAEADAILEQYGQLAYLQSITVGDRSKTFRSPSEFMAWRSRLQAEVKREANTTAQANGGANRQRLYVRFGATR